MSKRPGVSRKMKITSTSGFKSNRHESVRTNIFQDSWGRLIPPDIRLLKKISMENF